MANVHRQIKTKSMQDAIREVERVKNPRWDLWTHKTINEVPVGFPMVWDTLDPYLLVQEAREAKELLEAHYITGDLACDEDGATISPLDEGVYGWCAMGAVMKVQGHEAVECNLIQVLNAKAADNHDGRLVYQVNDGYGKAETLQVFQDVIDDLEAEIIHAEEMASAYNFIIPDPLVTLVAGLLEAPKQEVV